jgi:hypothetical protein
MSQSLPNLNKKPVNVCHGCCIFVSLTAGENGSDPFKGKTSGGNMTNREKDEVTLKLDPLKVKVKRSLGCSPQASH